MSTWIFMILNRISIRDIYKWSIYFKIVSYTNAMFVSHFVCIVLPCIPSCQTLNDCVCPEKTVQSVIEKNKGTNAA